VYVDHKLGKHVVTVLCAWLASGYEASAWLSL